MWSNAITETIFRFMLLGTLSLAQDSFFSSFSFSLCSFVVKSLLTLMNESFKEQNETHVRCKKIRPENKEKKITKKCKIISTKKNGDLWCAFLRWSALRFFLFLSHSPSSIKLSSDKKKKNRIIFGVFSAWIHEDPWQAMRVAHA